MKLIVGLGNPGKEYENTRHNMGFMAIDYYCNKHNISDFKEKFNGLYCKTIINGESIIFLKPLSFMNLSGTVVRKYLDYYNIDINDLLVIHDDLDMPTAKIKLKTKGSSGGHNGIKNIIENTGTESFKRLKIGISKNNNDIIDYVLGKFSKEDIDLLNKTFDITDNIIEDFIKINFDKLMSRYNGAGNETVK